ncbi:hypothetical protein Dimus_020779, partial [Dionaea muscipula]
DFSSCTLMFATDGITSLPSHCPLRAGLNHAAVAGCEMGCAWAADYDGLQAKLRLASTLLPAVNGLQLHRLEAAG